MKLSSKKREKVKVEETEVGTAKKDIERVTEKLGIRKL